MCISLRDFIWSVCIYAQIPVNGPTDTHQCNHYCYCRSPNTKFNRNPFINFGWAVCRPTGVLFALRSFVQFCAKSDQPNNSVFCIFIYLFIVVRHMYAQCILTCVFCVPVCYLIATILQENLCNLYCRDSFLWDVWCQVLLVCPMSFVCARNVGVLQGSFVNISRNSKHCVGEDLNQKPYQSQNNATELAELPTLYSFSTGWEGNW